MEILTPIIGIIGFVFAIVIHELSHGVVAERMGDPTARLMGRLTLNPIPHIDILGSIILPFSLFLLGSPFLFGWAKPVPVDPYNLKNPRKDLALISLSGPLSNLLMALVLSVFLRIHIMIFPNSVVFSLFFYLITFNIALAIFNLIPIHPLDGGKVMAGILPQKQAKIYDRFVNRFGMLLILTLILPIFGKGSLIMIIISPIIRFFLNLLIPGFSAV